MVGCKHFPRSHHLPHHHVCASLLELTPEIVAAGLSMSADLLLIGTFCMSPQVRKIIALRLILPLAVSSLIGCLIYLPYLLLPDDGQLQSIPCTIVAASYWYCGYAAPRRCRSPTRRCRSPTRTRHLFTAAPPPRQVGILLVVNPVRHVRPYDAPVRPCFSAAARSVP